MAQEKTCLRFIFQNHDVGTDHTESVVSSLKDCQVIFLEAVSLHQTSEERQATEGYYNFALTTPNDTKKLETWQSYVAQLKNSGHPIDRLIGSLAGTNIHLYFVDADPTCDFFPLFEQANTLHKQIVYALKLGQIDQARSFHHQLVNIRAELQFKRENLVRSQIEGILISLPVGSITQAAIIQGTIHQPTSTLFNTERFEVESLVFDPDLPPEAVLWLKKRQGLDIPELEYQKALLSCYLLPLAYDDESVMSGANPSINQYLARLVDQLTPEQLHSTYVGFEIIYNQKLIRLCKNSRPGSADRATFGPFVYNQAALETLHTLERNHPLQIQL